MTMTDMAAARYAQPTAHIYVTLVRASPHYSSFYYGKFSPHSSR
jgi:hypothetical protein